MRIAWERTSGREELKSAWVRANNAIGVVQWEEKPKAGTAEKMKTDRGHPEQRKAAGRAAESPGAWACVQGSSNAESRKGERKPRPCRCPPCWAPAPQSVSWSSFFSEWTNSLSYTPSHVFVSSPDYQGIVKLVSREWGSRSASPDSG